MLQIIDHLVSMFKLIDSITYEMYSKDNTFQELSLALECLNPVSIDVFNKEWPLNTLSYNFNDLPHILQTGTNTKKIRTGPSYCDIVWVEGIEERGVIEATMIRGPVLVLEVYSIIGEVECPLYLRQTPFFRNFVRLLKLCLGGRSAVYLTVSIDGFFGLLTEVV